MLRRRPAPLEGVKGEQPPLELATVWASWVPAADGPTVVALRAFLESIDRIAGAGRQPTEAEGQQVADLTHSLWLAATLERHAELAGGG